MQKVSSTQRGFTLFELMATIALAAVIVGLAIPNMSTFSKNNRLTGASNDLLRSFQVARSEAIKRQRNVVVCASSSPTASNASCSYGAFSGWIVFQDTDNDMQHDAGEPYIEQHNVVDEEMTVANDNDGIQSYGPAGFANPSGAKVPTRNIAIYDKRGNHQVDGNSTARAVVITQTGRVRVTRLYPEVSTAFSAIGITEGT